MTLVEAARSFLGSAWRHRGRTAKHMDCIGLLALSFRKAGVYFPDESSYGREPWEDRLRQGCIARWGESFPKEQAQSGDIALIRYRAGEPSHVGIIGDYQGTLTLIHAHNKLGVIEQSLRDQILKMVIEVYRP